MCQIPATMLAAWILLAKPSSNKTGQLTLCVRLHRPERLQLVGRGVNRRQQPAPNNQVCLPNHHRHVSRVLSLQNDAMLGGGFVYSYTRPAAMSHMQHASRDCPAPSTHANNVTGRRIFLACAYAKAFFFWVVGAGCVSTCVRWLETVCVGASSST